MVIALLRDNILVPTTGHIARGTGQLLRITCQTSFLALFLRPSKCPFLLYMQSTKGIVANVANHSTGYNLLVGSTEGSKATRCYCACERIACAVHPKGLRDPSCGWHQDAPVT